MNNLKKISSIIQKNPQYVIGLCFFVILFAIFCDGLLAGTITALSAFGCYVCGQKLYTEFKNTSVKKTPKTKTTKSTVKKNKK